MGIELGPTQDATADGEGGGEEKRCALGRRLIESDIRTIMSRGIRDAWKFENDADTYQSPGGENRRFEGDTGFEDRLRDMSYIDLISGVVAFSNFRDLFN